MTESDDAPATGQSPGMFDVTVDASDPTAFDMTPVSAEPLPTTLPNPMALGPYTLSKRLGAGGMAEVFYAEKTNSGVARPVVIKRMLPHIAQQPKYVDMFKREAEVASRLNHPHIVQIYELGHADDTHYIAMEYVDGITLHQLAQRAWRAGKSIPIELILFAVADAAEALHYAYTVNLTGGGPLRLIHRDISPDNLIIDRQGHTKILDFGIAKAADSRSVTKTGEMKGKIPFMSPEQLAGRALTHQSDLYALGVVLFWLLTGRRPFRGESDLLLMQSIVRDPPVAPSTLNEEVPKALDLWCLNLMAKRPELRPLDGAFVNAELQKLVVGERGRLAPFVEEVMNIPPNGEPVLEGRGPKSRPVTDSVVTAWNRQPTRLYSRKKLLTLDAIQKRANAEDALAVATASEDVDLSRAALQAARKRQSHLPAVMVGLMLAALAAFVFLYLEVYGADSAVPSPQREVAAAIPDPVPPPDPTSKPPDVAPDPNTPPDEEPKAAPPKTAAAPTSAAKKPRAKPRRAPRTKDVAVVGKGVRWTLPSKKRLTPEDGKANVPSSTKSLFAVDKKTGGRSRVPIKDGVADLGTLKKGKLAIRVNPYAEVTVGRRALGSTPFPPLSLREGTYWLTFKHKDKSVTKTVSVKPGKTTTLKVDMTKP